MPCIERDLGSAKDGMSKRVEDKKQLYMYAISWIQQHSLDSPNLTWQCNSNGGTCRQLVVEEGGSVDMDKTSLIR
jgi:hypothetical protein